MPNYIKIKDFCRYYLNFLGLYMKNTNINKQNDIKRQKREEKLANQLRQNLFKRKAQARNRLLEEAKDKQ